MSDIFREIDEELRRDNLLKIWQRYNRYIIGAVVLALLVAGAIVAWRSHQLSLRQAQSVRYEAALSLLREGKDAEAAKIFASVADEGGGYGQLALFEAADLAAKAGDKKSAIADYDKIAASSNIDPELRDAATLLSVMNGFADSDPQAVIDRLKPLTESGNAWRASALELTAAAKLKAGDKAAALDIYKKLADDLAAPEGMRARAAEMAAVLGS
ncbi:MAG TPA: tetratricopeptide repeat protein [Stellaceae bacterium]|nr:tetratricopeptide repeat protein [Stellaceae bacterium]